MAYAIWELVPTWLKVLTWSGTELNDPYSGFLLKTRFWGKLSTMKNAKKVEVQYRFCAFAVAVCTQIFRADFSVIGRGRIIRWLLSIVSLSFFCILHPLRLQLHDAIYRLRFYSNSLIRVLSLSNSHNNVVSIQKNRGDKPGR